VTDRDFHDVASKDPGAAVARRSGVMRGIDAVGWRWIRIAALAVYIAVLVGVLIEVGVPTGRNSIAIIMISGLAISTIGRGWRRLGQVLLDWLPFTLVLEAYDKTRAVADAIGMPLHEGDVVTAEKWLCFGTVPTVWLQEHLYNPNHIYWYDALMTLIYTSHFLATPILAAVLWLRNRVWFVQFISRVIVLSVAGLATYILFPEAPPWMASRDGFISQHIVRLSARGWIWLHASNVKGTLAHAQKDGTNPVAAMPSLHVAFACLVAIFIGSKLRSKWRWLLVLYPMAMGFSLVYLGEHYVVDLIAGLAYALAVHYGLNRWERMRADRRRLALADGRPIETGDPEDLASVLGR
jgi:membrane-associated phospholipid phosphatase